MHLVLDKRFSRQAKNIEKSSFIDAIVSSLKTVEIGESQTQHGFKITL